MRPRPAAIAAVFVANGLGGPSFLPRLPERQASLGLSDAGLGIVLVGMAVGALAASPLAGRAVARLGSRPVAVAAAVGLGASLWAAGAAPHPVLLFGALAVIGAADAAMDISMNANGAAYEQASGRSLLHRLHGAWSLGSLAAAGTAAVLAAAGVSLTWHLLGVGITIATIVLVSRRWLVEGDRHVAPTAAEPDGHEPDGREPDGRSRRWRPGGPLVVLASITLAGAVIEGAPSDWSAIRLERLGAGPGAAALGFAAFTAGMLAARMAGDRLTDRFGGPSLLRGGMALVAVGLLAGSIVDHPAAFTVGLLVAGAGAAGLFPLMFSAAATTPGVAAATGAATVSLAARLGFLVEPALMGGLSQLLGLRVAFAVVAGLAVVVAVVGAAAIRDRGRPVDREDCVPDLRTG